jgi:pyrimidine 5'-nucleotidase
MADLIDKYFATHLSLPWADAVRLHKEYYQNYGLAIEGLVRHHQINPLDYNAKVDDALPLEGVIKPRPELKRLLADIDRSKVKLWLFTNAYVNHAKRVIRLLEVEEFFEGITYCDYGAVPLACKPHPDMYQKAMREAGVEKHEDCFFVGKLSTPWNLNHSQAPAPNMAQMTRTKTARKRRSSAGRWPISSKRASSHRGRRPPNTKFGTSRSCGQSFRSSSAPKPAEGETAEDVQLPIVIFEVG